MDARSLTQMWEHMRPKYGVFLRLLEALPEGQYYALPVPGMRSAAELAVHTASLVRDIAQGVRSGRIAANEAADGDVATRLGNKAAIIGYARRCWDEASGAVAAIGDAQLAATVETPWNMSFPGFVGISILYDEFVHHRGQLYVYARLFGVEPPFLWSFGENAPDFRPAHAGAGAGSE